MTRTIKGQGRLNPPEKKGVAMDYEALEKFKSMFEEERKKLVYSRSIIDETLGMAREDMADESDLTAQELEKSMRTRLRSREALYLKKINEALRRIYDGDFGVCEECGGDIEIRRLEARPTATMCVSCKEDQEHQEQLHIDGHKSKSLGKKLRLA